jgi:ABC-2 type transport system permease protein
MQDSTVLTQPTTTIRSTSTLQGLHSFGRLTWIQLKLYAREPVAFFFTLIFPVLLLAMYGLIWGNAPGSGYYQDYGYIDMQLPALTAVIIGTVGLMSVPVSVATNREQKILRRFKASPMRPLTYIAADVTVNYLIALAGMIAVIIVGKLVFDLRFAGSLPAFFAGFTLATLAFIAMGYIVASLAPTARVAQVVGQLVFFPMMFLSGATLPLFMMPEGVQRIAEWLPLTQVVILLQELWLGIGWNMTAVIVLTMMLVVGTIVSARVFRWE